ncbi:MAG: arsenical pump-driving ATPase, partial [Zoogloeaceae bacterium]|nr:arsenical pump-driving ATPase [Zoogloeaceae bacterium]
IEPWAWVINNSLSASATTSPLLARRAAQEWPQIEAVRELHARRVALVPIQAEEPIGVERLAALASGKTATL